VKTGKRNEECRTAVQKEKNNMRKIMLQKMTRSNKETYREHRKIEKQYAEKRKEKC
jgi:hypothetical protein